MKREWSSYDFQPFEEGDPLLIVEAITAHGTGLANQEEIWRPSEGNMLKHNGDSL